jgi:hypothetical protein
MTAILRRLTKNAPSKRNIRTKTIRDRAARSAARYARAEAGSSVLELMFLSWLDKKRSHTTNYSQMVSGRTFLSGLI